MIKYIVLLIERVDTCIDVLRRIYALMEKLSTQEAPPYALPQSEDGHRSLWLSVMDVPPDEPLLTIQEACDRIGISRGTLNNLRNRGLLTNVNNGGRDPRFRADEVERLRNWYSVRKGKI